MANPTLSRKIPTLLHQRVEQLRSGQARPLLILFTIFCFLALVWGTVPSLDWPAKVVLSAFGVAAIAWSTTGLNATYIALAAAFACTLALSDHGVEVGLSSLADDTVLLIVGAFVLAAAIGATGLSERFVNRMIRLTPTLSSLCFALTGTLLILSLFVPSTSGRAALMVPTFLALRNHLNHEGAIRAIAILIPAIIVLSSSSTLVSSGANLVAAETVSKLTGQHISYADWLLVHLPLAIVSCLVTCWAILHVFVDRASRSMDISLFLATEPAPSPVSKRQSSKAYSTVFVVGVVCLVLAGWMTHDWHRIPAGMVALAGALLVTLPGISPIGFKEAIKGIDWSLILFLAASLQIGLAIIDSGLADWAVNLLLTSTDQSALGPLSAIILLTLIGLCAHLVITSRTARTAAFLPPVLLIAMSFGLDVIAVTHLMAVALGYCLTLIVGSKALVIFSEVGGTNFSQRDLLHLSNYLIPIHIFLFLSFVFVVWPMLGVSVIEPAGVTGIILPVPVL